MVSDWDEVLLGEHCIKIGSGATPRGGSSVYLEEGEISLIRSQNIYNDGFQKGGLVYITEEAAEKLKNVIVKDKDVLLNITGDSVARVCLVDNGFLPARVNQHVSIIRPCENSFDPIYLRYQLVSPTTQRLLLNLASAGATRNALTKNMIETLVITKPDLKTQKAIAHILGSLDDKIELNRQMNETLEAMAQALFKSWFVDFDPVLDNALAAGNPIPDELLARAEQRQAMPPSDTDNHAIRALFPDAFEFTEEMGWIPRGWKVTPLAALIKLTGGGTPKTSVEEYWNGDIPWFSVVDAPSSSDIFVLDTEKHVTSLGVEKSSTKILPVGTTIISARGTVGKCAMVSRPMAMNQSCYGILGQEGISDTFVYYSVFLSVSELQNKGHGSVFNTITGDTFKSIDVAFGGESLTKEFDNLVSPYFAKILANGIQRNTLAKLRDTLLPKLLSGELRITDAADMVDEV